MLRVEEVLRFPEETTRWHICKESSERFESEFGCFFSLSRVGLMNVERIWNICKEPGAEDIAETGDESQITDECVELECWWLRAACPQRQRKRTNAALSLTPWRIWVFRFNAVKPTLRSLFLAFQKTSPHLRPSLFSPLFLASVRKRSFNWSSTCSTWKGTEPPEGVFRESTLSPCVFFFFNCSETKV